MAGYGVVAASIVKKARWFVVLPVALALLVGLYALAGFWLVPKIGRSQAIAHVDETLHKQLKVGEVTFNPFTFELHVSDVAVWDKSALMLSLKHVYVDFELQSLWKRAWTFREVALERPFIAAVVREDGSLNLKDLIPPQDGEDTPLPSLWVQALHVRQGRTHFTDRSRTDHPGARINPIEFDLLDFHTTAGGGGFDLNARLDDHTSVAWKGQLSLQPVASKGSFAIKGVSATGLYKFVSDLLPFVVTNGSFSLGGTYTFSVGGNAGLQFDATIPKLHASSLAIRARGVDDDWVTVPTATLDNTRLSYAKHQVSVDRIGVQGMAATVWLEKDGTLNIDRLLTSVAPAAPAASAPVVTKTSGNAVAATADDWELDLKQLVLEQAAVDLEDRTVSPAGHFVLAPMQLTADALSLDMTRPVPITMQATINGKAPLTVAGNVVPDTFAADLQIDVSKMPLSDVMSYLPTYPGLVISSGVAAAKGAFQLLPTEAPGPEMHFVGVAQLDSFRIDETRGKKEFVSWKALSVDGLEYSAVPDSISMKQVRLVQPSARVIIAPDQSINLVTIFGGDAPPTKLSATAASADLPVRIDRISMEGGELDFADLSIEPDFRARISALRGEVLGLSTRINSVAKIDLHGQVINKYSPVTINGKTNLTAYDTYTDVTMSFKNIELPVFNPYSGRFAGYAIAKGKLSTDLHYVIDHRKITADHHVVIDQLEWGEATESKDKVSLPIRFATSLLKDSDGVIDLELPVTGTLDDPKFRIGPVIWQVIKNVMTKVVTAPFKFLGSMFEGAEEAKFVDFAPGSAALPADASKNLSALASALASKPNLRLEIPSGKSPEADATGMARQRLDEAVTGMGKGEATAVAAMTPKDQLDVMSDLYLQVMGSKPQLPEDLEAAAITDDAGWRERRVQKASAENVWISEQLLARYQPSPADLVALAQSRADAIQDALLSSGEIDPARVFITTDKSPVMHDDKVRVELGLE